MKQANLRCAIWHSKILARIAFVWLVAWVTVLAQDAALLEVTTFRNQDLEGYPTLATYVDKDASWTISGLGTNFVPQGIVWIPDSDLMLVSGYQGVTFKKDWALSSNLPFMRRITTVTEKLSMVFLVQNGIPIRAAYLAYENGKPMKRHAGGVAVWNGYFWIPSSYRIYRFPLKSILDADEKVVTVKSDHPKIPVDSTGAFISAHGEDLLIGDFARTKTHPVPDHHKSPTTKHQAWTAAYRMDKATSLPLSTNRYQIHDQNNKTYDVLRPDYVLHHRQLVQGIAIREDGLIALSVSYGNTDSKIAFYQLDIIGDPALAPDQTSLPDGTPIPSWTLSTSNWTGKTITAPPGSQGLDWRGHHLAIAFEGGAYPYRQRWTTIEDRVLIQKFTDP